MFSVTAPPPPGTVAHYYVSNAEQGDIVDIAPCAAADIQDFEVRVNRFHLAGRVRVGNVRAAGQLQGVATGAAVDAADGVARTEGLEYVVAGAKIGRQALGIQRARALYGYGVAAGAACYRRNGTADALDGIGAAARAGVDGPQTGQAVRVHCELAAAAQGDELQRGRAHADANAPHGNVQIGIAGDIERLDRIGRQTEFGIASNHDADVFGGAAAGEAENAKSRSNPVLAESVDGDRQILRPGGLVDHLHQGVVVAQGNGLDRVGIDVYGRTVLGARDWSVIRQLQKIRSKSEAGIVRTRHIHSIGYMTDVPRIDLRMNGCVVRHRFQGGPVLVIAAQIPLHSVDRNGGNGLRLAARAVGVYQDALAAGNRDGGGVRAGTDFNGRILVGGQRQVAPGAGDSHARAVEIAVRSMSMLSGVSR